MVTQIYFVEPMTYRLVIAEMSIAFPFTKWYDESKTR